MKNYSPLLLLFLLLNCVELLNAQSNFLKTFGSVEDEFGTKIVRTADGKYTMAATSKSKLMVFQTDSLGNSTWAKGFNNPQGYPWSRWAVIETVPAGGFILSGAFSKITDRFPYACFIRINSSGDTLWTRVVGDRTFVYDLIALSDGGFACTGRYTGGSFEEFIMKIDSSGNVLWRTMLTLPSNMTGYSLKETQNGGLFVAGHEHFNLLKLDASGNIIWAKIYGSPGGTFSCYDMDMTADGGFVFIGECDSLSNTDAFMVKVDSLGQPVWSYKYKWIGNQIGQAVKTTSDHGFVILGNTSSGNQNPTDIFLIKTDSSGVIQWSRLFGGPLEDMGYDVLEHDGKFSITGLTKNVTLGFSDIALIQYNPSDSFSCHTDTVQAIRSAISIVSNNQFVLTSSGFGYEPTTILTSDLDTTSHNMCNCIPPELHYHLVEANECVIFDGYTSWGESCLYNFGNSVVSNDPTVSYCYYVNGVYNVCVTVSNDCGTVTQCDTIIVADVGISEDSKNLYEFIVSPNPFIEETKITFSKELTGKTDLLICDLPGRILRIKENVESGEFVLEQNKMAAGTYLLLLRNEGRVVATKKMIIQ